MNTTIVQLFINNETPGVSLHLHPNDRIQAYFSIDAEQSLSDAFQSVRLSHNYQSSGCYAITKQLLNDSGSFTFTTLREFHLDGCSLTDQDVYFLFLPFLTPFPQLAAFSIQNNLLTDVAARIIAFWLAKGNAPALKELRIGQNFWQGEGLIKLLFAAKTYCRVETLVEKGEGV